MLAVIPAPIRELPSQWHQRVRERRALTTIDPAADALERAAKELEAAIAAGQQQSRVVGTTEFARLRGVLPSTVRKWCARGKLAGATRNDAGDWAIPADAKITRAGAA